MSLCVIECRLRVYKCLNAQQIVDFHCHRSLPLLVISPHPPSSTSHTHPLTNALSLSLIVNLLFSVSLPSSDVQSLWITKSRRRYSRAVINPPSSLRGFLSCPKLDSSNRKHFWAVTLWNIFWPESSVMISAVSHDASPPPVCHSRPHILTVAYT